MLDQNQSRFLRLKVFQFSKPLLKSQNKNFQSIDVISMPLNDQITTDRNKDSNAGGQIEKLDTSNTALFVLQLYMHTCVFMQTYVHTVH